MLEFQTTEIIGFNKESLNAILFLEQQCFPINWQYEGAREYYADMLRDPENINLLLRNGKSAVGYLLALHNNIHNHRILDEIKEHDSEFTGSTAQRFYVDTIQIIPASRGCGGSKKLLLTLCEEARKRGVVNFSIHARTTNGFNNHLKQLFEGNIIAMRKIARWQYAAGEPYEYLEWKLDEK